MIGVLEETVLCCHMVPELPPTCCRRSSLPRGSPKPLSSTKTPPTTFTCSLGAAVGGGGDSAPGKNR